MGDKIHLNDAFQRTERLRHHSIYYNSENALGDRWDMKIAVDTV